MLRAVQQRLVVALTSAGGLSNPRFVPDPVIDPPTGRLRARRTICTIRGRQHRGFHHPHRWRRTPVSNRRLCNGLSICSSFFTMAAGKRSYNPAPCCYGQLLPRMEQASFATKRAIRRLPFTKSSAISDPVAIFRPNHDDTRSIPYDGCEFSSSIADVLVFRKRDPTSPSNKRDPIFVRRVQRKVIVVYLNLHPRRTKPVCDNVLSKIAIQEEDGLFTLPV